MRFTWKHIMAVRRMWQDLPSKCFKDLEDLVSHMGPTVVIQKHYTFRELAFMFVLDSLFELDQRVSMHLSINCNEIVLLLIIICSCIFCSYLEENIVQPIAEIRLKLGDWYEAVKCACESGNTTTLSIRKSINILRFDTYATNYS